MVGLKFVGGVKVGARMGHLEQRVPRVGKEGSEEAWVAVGQGW